MSTQTGTQIYPRNNAVRANHTGVQVAVGQASLAVTGTASSVYLLCRVPHGAVILDFEFNGDDGGADNTWDLGILQPEGSTSGSMTHSQSALATVLSLSANTVPHRGTTLKLPYEVDIADAAIPRWAWVTATAAAAVSASVSIKIIVYYTMGDSTP